jgi:hypothetical protein
MGVGVTRVLERSRYLALVAAIALGISFVMGLGGPAGGVLSVLVGGLLAAATVNRLWPAALVAGASGLLGSGLASRLYRAPQALTALTVWHAGYPPSQLGDEFLTPLIKSGVVNGHWGRGDVWLILVITAGVVACALAAHWIGSRVPVGRLEAARVAAGVIVVLAVSVTLVLGASSGAFRERSVHPLAAGKYRFDAAIYMNAYFNLLDGMPYYEGFVKAAAGDGRLVAERDVRNGRFYGWAYSAAFIRMPWTFYIWRVLAPTGGLFYVSMALCVMGLFAVFWGLYPTLSVRAALVPPILFPLLMTCTGWLNMFFPDWWAGLAILFSVMFQIRKRYLLAATFAVLAGVFRDVTLIWLAILTVHALYRAARGDRDWRLRAGVHVALMVGFFALYFAHLRAGAPYVATQPTSLTVWDRLAISASYTLGQRFFTPASYMMNPYGSAIGRHASLMFAQLLGWWLVLRGNVAALVPVLAFALFWIVFTLTIGAPSSYWGQMYTPVAVVGSAALLAWAAPPNEHAMMIEAESTAC